VTLNLAETSVVKFRPSVPYGANLFYLCMLLLNHTVIGYQQVVMIQACQFLCPLLIYIDGIMGIGVSGGIHRC